MEMAIVNCLRRLLGTRAGLPPPPPSPSSPGLALLGARGGGRESFLSLEAHTSSKASFCRRLSEESWATNIFGDRINCAVLGLETGCAEGIRAPGARTLHGERAWKDRSTRVGSCPFLGCPRGIWGLAGAQGRGTLTSLSARLACWHQSRTNPKPAPGKDKSLLAPAAAPGAWEGRSGEAAVGPPKAGAVDMCS